MKLFCDAFSTKQIGSAIVLFNSNLLNMYTKYILYTVHVHVHACLCVSRYTYMYMYNMYVFIFS